MKHSVLIHFLILLGSLVGAYLVWTREPTGLEDEIPIFNMRGSLDKILFSADDRRVEIHKHKENGESYVWLEVTTYEVPPKDKVPPAASVKDSKEKAGESLPVDKGKEAKATISEPTPKKVPKTKQFLGNKEVLDLMEQLSKLSAVRSLGLVASDKLKEYGLSDKKKVLTLVSGATPRVFIIGSTTYGNMDTYLQDKADGRVYVVRPKYLEGIQYAEYRFMERDPFGIDPTEIDRITVTAEGKSKSILQQNKRDPAAIFWADENSPTKKNELYKTWTNNLLRLRVSEYFAREEKSSGEKQRLKVEFFRGEKSLGSVTLFERANQATLPLALPNDKQPPAGTVEYLVFSTHTRSNAKVVNTLAEEILRDLPAILTK